MKKSVFMSLMCLTCACLVSSTVQARICFLGDTSCQTGEFASSYSTSPTTECDISTRKLKSNICSYMEAKSCCIKNGQTYCEVGGCKSGSCSAKDMANTFSKKTSISPTDIALLYDLKTECKDECIISATCKDGYISEVDCRNKGKVIGTTNVKTCYPFNTSSCSFNFSTPKYPESACVCSTTTYPYTKSNCGNTTGLMLGGDMCTDSSGDHYKQCLCDESQGYKSDLKSSCTSCAHGSLTNIRIALNPAGGTCATCGICSCNDGYEMKDGLCEPADCPTGYSTSIQSKDDCLKGATFTSNGQSGSLLCGKCECTNYHCRYSSVQIGNGKQGDQCCDGNYSTCDSSYCTSKQVTVPANATASATCYACATYYPTAWECNDGYEMNSDKTGCVEKCSETDYPYTSKLSNATCTECAAGGRYKCECKSGYTFDSATNTCVKDCELNGCCPSQSVTSTLCRIGDIFYSDGTCGSTAGYDPSKTPIGVVFAVYNGTSPSTNKDMFSSRGIIVNLRDLTITSDSTFIISAPYNSPISEMKWGANGKQCKYYLSEWGKLDWSLEDYWGANSRTAKEYTMLGYKVDTECETCNVAPAPALMTTDYFVPDGVEDGSDYKEMQWYLPSIVELDALSTASYNNGIVQTTLKFLKTCSKPAEQLSGAYWSVTCEAPDEDSAWYYTFKSSGAGGPSLGSRDDQRQVRAVIYFGEAGTAITKNCGSCPEETPWFNPKDSTCYATCPLNSDDLKKMQCCNSWAVDASAN